MRYRPWNGIKSGDTVYFKNSGEPVTVKAEVAKVTQFSDLNPIMVKKILNNYGEEDGLDKNKLPSFFNLFKEKKYCILVHLKNAENIEPFVIDKKGFGSMSAWITVDDISRITLK